MDKYAHNYKNKKYKNDQKISFSHFYSTWYFLGTFIKENIDFHKIYNISENIIVIVILKPGKNYVWTP